MGTTRLGGVPKTQPWTAVVERVATASAAGAGPEDAAAHGALAEDVSAIAQRTLEAAQTGLQQAVDDEGLSFAFFLLTQVALASREPDWVARLESLGIALSDDSCHFDLVSEMQLAIDRHVHRTGGPTDISEMAQSAVGAAITKLVGPKSRTLFGGGLEELRAGVRDCSTKAGFARLGQRFFGRFLARFLNFYLSRVTSAQEGSDAFQQIGDIASFNEALEVHCEQSAAIVRDFCGGWYSKTDYETGIDAENTRGFMAVALRKLREELQQQERRP